MATEPIVLPRIVQAKCRIGIAQDGPVIGTVGKIRFRFFMDRQHAAIALAQEASNLSNVSLHLQTGLFSVTPDKVEDLELTPVQTELEPGDFESYSTKAMENE